MAICEKASFYNISSKEHKSSLKDKESEVILWTLVNIAQLFR